MSLLLSLVAIAIAVGNLVWLARMKRGSYHVATDINVAAQADFGKVLGEHVAAAARREINASTVALDVTRVEDVERRFVSVPKDPSGQPRHEPELRRRPAGPREPEG